MVGIEIENHSCVYIYMEIYILANLSFQYDMLMHNTALSRFSSSYFHSHWPQAWLYHTNKQGTQNHHHLHLFHLELFLHRRFAILNFIRIKSKTSNRRVLLFIVVVAIFFARGAVSNCCRINRVIPILQSNSTQSFLFFHPPAFVLHSFIPSSSHNLQRYKIGISQLWKQREWDFLLYTRICIVCVLSI